MGKIVKGFIIPFMIGVIVLFPIILTNKDVRMFFGFSVVCTMGLGLVFWIPVAWLIGAPVIIIFRSFGKEKIYVPAKLLYKECYAVAKYIRQAKKDNFTDVQITSILKDRGWTEEIIQKAYEIVEKHTVY